MVDANWNSAFEYWKEGASKFPINSQAEFNAALGQFNKAIRQRESFARGYGWKAYSYAISVVDGWKLPRSEGSMKPDQVMKKAVELADHAVSLDDTDYDNYWARAYVRLHSGDQSGAAADFDRARQLNFGNRDLLVENADERVYAGDHDRAIEFVERALAVPDWHRWTLAWAYYFKGRTDPVYYDFALRQIEQLCEQPGGGRCPAETLIVVAATYAQKAHLATSKSKRDDLQARAEKACKAFCKFRRSWTQKNFKKCNPFQRKEDRDHLYDGLKKAKFP